MPPYVDTFLSGFGEYVISNNCGKAIDVGITYYRIDGSWETRGFYKVPNDGGVWIAVNYKDKTPLFSWYGIYYLHAHDETGKVYVGWQRDPGEISRTIGGRSYDFRKITGDRDEHYDWAVKPCG